MVTFSGTSRSFRGSGIGDNFNFSHVLLHPCLTYRQYLLPFPAYHSYHSFKIFSNFETPYLDSFMYT